MAVTSEAMAAMCRARMSLIFTQPFFGRLAARLEFIETSRVPTASTDGARLVFNPEFVMGLSKEEREFLVAHEVLHCALMHPYRLNGRDHKKANIAMDYAVNLILVDAGLVMPKQGLFDIQYANMTWEHIYTLLPESLGQGSAGFGDVTAASGEASSAEESAWQVAVAGAISEAMERGDCSATLQREAERARKPKVSWKDQLWYLVEKMRGSDDFCYAVPNKKLAVTGCFSPSTFSEQTQPLAVIVDTSGSIDESLLSEFLAEIHSLVDALNPESVHFCCADAAVHAVGEWRYGDAEIVLTVVGGGGTDFRPALAWADAIHPQVGLTIYFTDLMGEFPSKVPDVDVLWVTTTALKPPFGNVIQIL